MGPVRGNRGEQRSSWGGSGRPPSASASRCPEGTMPCQSTQRDNRQRSRLRVHSPGSRPVTKAARSCRPCTTDSRPPIPEVVAGGHAVTSPLRWASTLPAGWTAPLLCQLHRPDLTGFRTSISLLCHFNPNVVHGGRHRVRTGRCRMKIQTPICPEE